MSRLSELSAEARKHPRDPGVWTALGQELVVEGHLGAALEAAGRARALAETVSAWLEVGHLYSALEERPAALAAYRDAARLHRSQGVDGSEAGRLAYLHLGQALGTQNDVEAAVLTLRVAVRLGPEDPACHRALAEALEQQGQLSEAAHYAERAVELDFDAPEGHRLLARLHAGLGHPADSVEALRQLAVVAPDDVSGALQLGAGLAAAGERSEARRLIRQLAQRIEPTPTHLRQLGWAWSEVGDVDEALRVLRSALRAAPEDTGLHLTFGRVLERHGQSTDAAAAYRAAIELDEASAEAHRRLGVLLLQLERPNEAVPELVRASSLDPDDTRLRRLLARALEAEALESADLSSVAPEDVVDVAAATRELAPSETPLRLRPDSDPPVPGARSFTGDLAVFALSEVLEFLLVQRASGRLTVVAEGGGPGGELDLVAGCIADARWGRDVSLARGLEVAGVDLQGRWEPGDAGPEPLLGPWVVAQARADQEQVADALRRVVLEALSGLMTLQQGHVQFDGWPGAEAAGDEGLFVDPRWALLELARLSDEASIP